jgi:glycosyltransferase involved in cell wall biosynthesis
MNIAIDCRHIDSSGIGVYLRGCLPVFLKSDNFFFLLGSRDKIAQFSSGFKNAEIVDCGIKPFSMQELFFFPKNILSIINKCDLYYSPFFNIPGKIKIPVYTTIHDIIFPDMPELTSSAGLALRMWFFRRAFSRSKKIFTVSEFSKSRIEHYSRGEIPVIVTHSAIQPWIQKKFKAGIEKKDTIVFIGNIKKHKGLDCLLEAFRLAREEGLNAQLIIIGSRDNFRTKDNSIMQKIDSLGSEAACFTGFISNEDLAEKLMTASLLVQPSLYEGFGLPPLEAMALGTHALISDIPVFREIYGSFPVVFFKAGDSVDLKNKMTALLKNNDTSLVLPNHLLSMYTFEKTAQVIMREFR